MPNWRQALKAALAEMSQQNAGDSTQECPYLNTGLIVQVVDGMTYDIVVDVEVKLAGPETPSGKTGAETGIASFRPLEPGR